MPSGPTADVRSEIRFVNRMEALSASLAIARSLDLGARLFVAGAPTGRGHRHALLGSRNAEISSAIASHDVTIGKCTPTPQLDQASIEADRIRAHHCAQKVGPFMAGFPPKF